MRSGATDHTIDPGTEAIELIIDGFRTLSQGWAALVDARAAMVGVTWMIRILRTAEAMIALYKQGLGDTATSPIRHARMPLPIRRPGTMWGVVVR